MPKTHKRPFVVTLLIILFVIGTIAGLLSVFALIFPGSFLEAIWRANPHAREGFARIGGWAVVLMSVVFVACLLAAIGLWRGLLWGYWLTVAMLTVNLVGSVVNVVTGTEPRAIVGIPIVLILLFSLMRNTTREYFRPST